MYKLIEPLLCHVTWKCKILFLLEISQLCDCEFIHVECWKNDDSYKLILLNWVDGNSHSQLLVHDVVVIKLTYEEKDAKGEIVNIYKKPQTLINYLIDLCSNEGDWVLDSFLGSGKFYYIKLNFNIFFCFYVFILIYLFLLCLMTRYNTSIFPTKRKKLHCD